MQLFGRFQLRRAVLRCGPAAVTRFPLEPETLLGPIHCMIVHFLFFQSNVKQDMLLRIIFILLKLVWPMQLFPS